MLTVGGATDAVLARISSAGHLPVCTSVRYKSVLLSILKIVHRIAQIALTAYVSQMTVTAVFVAQFFVLSVGGQQCQRGPLGCLKGQLKLTGGVAHQVPTRVQTQYFPVVQSHSHGHTVGLYSHVFGDANKLKGQYICLLGSVPTLEIFVSQLLAQL